MYYRFRRVYIDNKKNIYKSNFYLNIGWNSKSIHELIGNYDMVSNNKIYNKLNLKQTINHILLTFYMQFLPIYTIEPIDNKKCNITFLNINNVEHILTDKKFIIDKSNIKFYEKEFYNLLLIEVEN